MSNIKDKLIEIAKEIIINNADCSEISDDIITLDEFSYDHACEEIADKIISNLPELLADSEWVTTPFKIDDEVWFVNKYKLEVQKGRIYKYTITRGITDQPCYEMSISNGEGYIVDHYGTSYNIFHTKAEAEARLIELKAEIKENENE